LRPDILRSGSAVIRFDMNRIRAALFGALCVLLGGCKALMPGAASSANSCGDPCAAMVCPGGSQCTWDGNCHARCEVQPLSPNGH
jgi:hypothetical protein